MATDPLLSSSRRYYCHVSSLCAYAPVHSLTSRSLWMRRLSQRKTRTIQPLVFSLISLSSLSQLTISPLFSLSCHLSLPREEAEYKKLETAMQKAKDQFTAFERQDAKLREEVKHITTKIKKLAKQTEVCGYWPAIQSMFSFSSSRN